MAGMGEDQVIGTLDDTLPPYFSLFLLQGRQVRAGRCLFVGDLIVTGKTNLSGGHSGRVFLGEGLMTRFAIATFFDVLLVIKPRRLHAAHYHHKTDSRNKQYTLSHDPAFPSHLRNPSYSSVRT